MTLTVTNSGIGIDSETESIFENETRIGIGNGNDTEIKNGTRVENNSGHEIRIKSVTGIGMENENGIDIDIDQYKKKNLLYVHGGGFVGFNYADKLLSKKCRTTSAGQLELYKQPPSHTERAATVHTPVITFRPQIKWKYRPITAYNPAAAPPAALAPQFPETNDISNAAAGCALVFSASFHRTSGRPK
ncbi:hypothetical protein EVAR_2345_1 [Eumeta japonica]|uniref:Uncharacterized protein n=1 Tax=Eumeta variegata TaxID=151549 RepID=A0A4C1SI83_EUMVA|nr:hypothetical protein EVAR_2345_1 [Eumeta japonica]